MPVENVKPERESRQTIFTDILDWMLVPVIILFPLGMGFIYLLSVSLANNALDQSLVERLRIFASQLEWRDGKVRADPHLLPWVSRDEQRYFAVQDVRGNHLFGTESLPFIVPSASGDITTVSADLQEQRIRSAAMRVFLPGAQEAVLVAVAEPASSRESLAREFMFEMLVAQIMIVISMVLLMGYGLRRGTAPLEKLRARVASRSPDDLDELEIADAPFEVRPLVNAFNQLLKQVQSASAGQRRFIANAAHQLRTPLAGITTQTQLALRQSEGHSREALLNIEKGTARSAHLVNQLLALSRAESVSGASLRFEAVDLCALARDVAESSLSQAAARSIDLGVDLPDTATAVQGDPTLLRELLANLVDNAIKYSEPGGQVTVRVSTPATLEVEDGGIGIPVEDRELVFERFHRVMGTRTDGSGLGLSIVREVADRHAAKVRISEPASGRGTLVRVVFPQG